MKKKHKSKTIANVGTYKESHKSNGVSERINCKSFNYKLTKALEKPDSTTNCDRKAPESLFSKPSVVCSAHIAQAHQT